MTRIHRAVWYALLLAAGAAGAETVACPDLATAVQVNACPTEEELQYTFKGYCGDNARMYDRGEQLCVDYARYRRAKNVSLWETRDGRFNGYVSCESDASPPAVARAVGMRVDTQGSVTRIACRYDNGVVFTHRTKARCAVVVADCAGAPAECKAECR